jgi:hypothetical protein
MPTRFLDWFINNQLKIMSVIGVVCTVLVLVIGGPWLFILAQTTFSLVVAFIGAVLYEGETPENWLDFSWSSWARNIFGGILIGFAWMMFVGGRRGGGVIGDTIANVLVRLG